MGEQEAVQRTNDDATYCKRSAVQYGYWHDPYLAHMCKFIERKAPEIHLGYYTRVKGLMNLLEKSLAVLGPNTQIINIGAGFDTLFWRLRDEKKQISNFIEVDLAGVTAKKCFLIKKSKLLLKEVAGEDGDGDIKLSSTDLHGQDYHLVAADLTNLSSLQKKLEESGIDYSKPTVFMAECVLVYLQPEQSNVLLKWMVSKFTNTLVFLDHEQVNIGDRFGEVMLENLTARGCGLPGVLVCKDKSTHINRFIACNWDASQCWTMNEVYNLLPRSEIDKVETLELFDERELMNQLFEHYCLTVAWRNAKDISFDHVSFW